jgi:methylphosphotriester-DNA--protein-cysteine methyltransferase
MSKDKKYTSDQWSRTKSNEIAAGVGYDRIIIARTAAKAKGQDLPQAANAQLMSTAKDLLEACEAVLDAINQAGTGQPSLWINPPYVRPGVYESINERLESVIEKAKKVDA